MPVERRPNRLKEVVRSTNTVGRRLPGPMSIRLLISGTPATGEMSANSCHYHAGFANCLMDRMISDTNCLGAMPSDVAVAAALRWACSQPALWHSSGNLNAAVLRAIASHAAFIGARDTADSGCGLSTIRFTIAMWDSLARAQSAPHLRQDRVNFVVARPGSPFRVSVSCGPWTLS
jgi:hypothetical protein